AGRLANEKVSVLAIDTKRYAVLAAIAESDRPSQQDVAAALGIDRATLVALADDLEAQRLIRRDRSHADRRAYALTLTSKGATILKRADALMDQCEEESTGVLKPPDRAQLADLPAPLFSAAPPGWRPAGRACRA